MAAEVTITARLVLNGNDSLSGQFREWCLGRGTKPTKRQAVKFLASRRNGRPDFSGLAYVWPRRPRSAGTR